MLVVHADRVRLWYFLVRGKRRGRRSQVGRRDELERVRFGGGSSSSLGRNVTWSNLGSNFLYTAGVG